MRKTEREKIKIPFESHINHFNDIRDLAKHSSSSLIVTLTKLYKFCLMTLGEWTLLSNLPFILIVGD